MARKHWHIVLLLFYATIIRVDCAKDKFTEELLVKVLPSGHIYTHFQFTTTWDVTPGEPLEHFRLFPKPLGEILNHYSVDELHISLTQGLWRHEKWGYPVQEAPPGAEIWAWFTEGVTNVDDKWAGLVNGLSGLLCASLNFVNKQTSISPEIAFRPQGLSVTPEIANSTRLRYSTLPRETVCTENLTPWKKLLPCGVNSGLTVLLQASKVYSTFYHSMSLDVRPVCRDDSCREAALELTQSLAIVFDVMKTQALPDWSLRSLFGVGLRQVCPLADDSVVFVDVTDRTDDEGDLFVLSVEPTRHQVTQFEGSTQRTMAVYDLRKLSGKVMNIGARYAKRHPVTSRRPPWLYGHQFVTGYGQQDGGIMCDIHNTGPTVSATYLVSVPWYVQLYIHTLRVTRHGDGSTVRPLYVHYVPAKNRRRPHHLEILLTLGAESTTRVHIEFERALMKWNEYPPDANHGFYVGSAAIGAALGSAANLTAAQHPSGSRRLTNRLTGSAPYFIRLYTEPLLIALATPDFSMPYNVICLTGTVMAILFGTVHNVTTRRLVVATPKHRAPLRQRLMSLKDKLKACFSRTQTKNGNQSRGDLNQDVTVGKNEADTAIDAISTSSM